MLVNKTINKIKVYKILTRKTNCYHNDKTIQIYAILDSGKLGLMNITPIYFNRKRQYENDINGYIFETIKKAKEYCRDNLEMFI